MILNNSCKICSAKFRTSLELKKHQIDRKHDEEYFLDNSYECHTCGKRFPTMQAVCTHHANTHRVRTSRGYYKHDRIYVVA
jgi:uncharacterized Zn finger protein